MDHRNHNKEEQFRILFEQASDGIFVTDISGNFIDVNEAGYKMLGYAKEEITGLTIADILDKDEIGRLRPGIERLVLGERLMERGKFKRKDRSIFIAEISSTMLSDGRLLATVRDITDQLFDQQIIHKSEERFRFTLDHLLEGCMIIGFDWTYLYFNDAINKGNYSRKDLMGRSMLEMFPGVEQTKIFSHYKSCMEERIPQQFEEEYIFADGTSIWNTFSVEPIPEGIFVLALDITERKRAEETLRVSEAKWRGLFEILPVGVSVIDSNRKILDFNSALCQILDLSPEDLLNDKHLEGKYLNSVNTLINPDELPSYRAIHENKTIKDVEICVEKKDGSRKWINVNAAPFPTLKSSIVATIDITERKKWEEDIRISKIQLDQLYKHINEVREEERSVIAREIHDELGQSLASLKMDLIGMKEEIDEISELKFKIDQIIAQADSSIKTVQKISSALRPQILDELGLASAIEWLSNDCRKRSSIKCKLDLQDIEDLDKNVSISLFRIFQATMTNIMLHSKAKSVGVKLALNGQMLHLSVKDDGIGITQDQINSQKSFGIIGMMERAKQINGTFEIHSKINKGTEITVTVPITGKSESK